MQRLIILSMAFCGQAAFAGVEAPASPSFAGLQAFLGLALVVVLILALAWLAKRFNLGGMQGQKHMTTLAVLPLGAREKAVLVDIAGQQMLLGVAPGRVTALHVFDAPVVVAEPRPQAEGAVAGGDFAKKLAEMLRQSAKAHG